MYSPDKMMGSKGPTGLHGPITSTAACFAGRYSPTYRSPEPMARRCMPNPSGDLFSGLNDGLISRAEALAAVDIKHQAGGGGGPAGLPQLKHDMMYHHGMGAPPPVSRPHHQMGHMDGLDMLDPISTSSMTTLTPMSETPPSHMASYGMNHMMNHHHHHHHHHGGGKALANLKLPGVGALSQSTICRFESLTLSHNNMIALKPILQAWLEEAEAQAKNKRRDPDAPSVLPAGEKKRKRTSIAAPEKRSLEAYFAVQPRPSGEKIAAIAEKLDLKKNVVRVWFCNQRQKQKRMKFAAQH
ncbi:unnamed protein product [Callosobruchus maculatus]|uniref:POU domain protein n=1 Tax=Callosobruchus maculatus TaxID=64391 RepID=A0A653BZ85_CALMS|nr:unnamed protein product [Callosobruchus maculatus]